MPARAPENGFHVLHPDPLSEHLCSAICSEATTTSIEGRASRHISTLKGHLAMYYAVELGPYGDHADPRALAALARDAEQAGWDGFFIWDAMLHDPFDLP